MDKKSRNILRSVFWGVVALALVYLCLRSIDWPQFMQALKLCRWGYVLLSMAIGVVIFFLRGLRWRMLLLPFDPSTSRITCFSSPIHSADCLSGTSISIYVCCPPIAFLLPLFLLLFIAIIKKTFSSAMKRSSKEL